MGPRQTYRIVGFQQITSLGTAVGLTIPANTRPNAVLLQANTQAVRWRADGVAPTASVGMILPNSLTVGVPPLYYDGDLNAIRFIEVTAGGVLNITYLEDESL